MAANKLILGTAQLGLSYGINNTEGQIPFDKSQLLLENALDLGIFYLDTAEAYGNAHEIIGEFHLRHPRKEFQILTKLPHNFDCGVNQKFYEYMEELHVDSIWGFSFHSFENYQKTFGIIAEELALLKRNGHIQKIGVSVYTNEEAKIVLKNPLVDIIQLPFNLLDNINLRQDVLQEAKEKGVEVHVRSCFLQGLFFMDLKNEHPIVKRLYIELCKINDIAEKYAITVRDLALNYVNRNPLIDRVLIGVDSLEQLTENLQSLNVQVPEEALLEVNKIKIDNINLLNPALWKTIG